MQGGETWSVLEEEENAVYRKGAKQHNTKAIVKMLCK